MTTKPTQLPETASSPATQIQPLLPTPSSPLSPSFIDSSFRPFLIRCKRKLSELSLQNTSIVSNTNKSVFIESRARDDIIKINGENNRKEEEEEKDLPVEKLAKNYRHRAKIRICGGGKLKQYTKMMIDRKTSTGSNCSQQSVSNESALSSLNHVSSPYNYQTTQEKERLTQRRRKSSFKQILLNPSQLFYHHPASDGDKVGAKWRIQALPLAQNYRNNVGRNKTTNQTNVFTRRQLQKTMSIDDDDYEDASIEEEDEEENADIGSEEELYWLNNNRGSDNVVVGAGDDDEDDEDYDYDEGEVEGVVDGHCGGVDVEREAEARMKGQLSTIPMNFVSGMRMMRRLTVSSPRHQASFVSHR